MGEMTGNLRWVRGEKKVNLFPGHGHTSSPTEAASAATLRKLNLFHFPSVICNSTWLNTKVQSLFAKTLQVMASLTPSGPDPQLLMSLHFTAAGPECCTTPLSLHLVLMQLVRHSSEPQGCPIDSQAAKRRRLGHSAAGQNACQGIYAAHRGPKPILSSTSALPRHKTQWVMPVPSSLQHCLVHLERKYLRS